MISFEDFLLERRLTGSTKRTKMPQIVAHDMFMRDLLQHGIMTRNISLANPETLIPLQDKVDDAKVTRINDAIKSGVEMEPIVVSEDGYIIDGHHRWVAQKSKPIINCLEVGIRYDKLLDFLEGKSYVTRSH